MKEAIYIMGDSCTKCHLIKPHIVKWATINGYSLQEVLFDDENVKQFNVEAVPMLVLREDWEVKEILNEEWIVNLLSNQK